MGNFVFLSVDEDSSPLQFFNIILGYFVIKCSSNNSWRIIEITFQTFCSCAFAFSFSKASIICLRAWRHKGIFLFYSFTFSNK